MQRPVANAGEPPARRRVGQPKRVMIVDDSLIARTVLSRILEGEPDFEIVAKATTGEMAIARLAETPADVILLDLEMPGMGGIGALPRILKMGTGAKVLVVSALTAEGAEHTLKALSMGAADTLLKPRSGEFDAGYARALVSKIRALAGHPPPPSAAAPAPKPTPRLSPPARPLALAIGASTGGIHALCQLLAALPRSFDLPILVAQHLPESFMETLARQLAAASGRPAGVALAGQRIQPGHIYVAPGEGHLIVRAETSGLITGIARFAAPSGCTPSVDPLFETLAEAAGGRAVGVVLSGMGRDGAIGAARLSAAGGTIFAQDAATSAVWGMPRAVAEAGLAAAVLPPVQIAGRLADLLARSEVLVR